MKILVLGIGQSLRGDDGAGIAAVQYWQDAYPDTAALVRLELAEVPGLDVLERLTGMDAAILVDALQTGAPPGSLFSLEPRDLAAFGLDSGTAHGWGVAETLQLGLALQPALQSCWITLIGISGQDFQLGTDLSPALRGALAHAAERIQQLVAGLLETGQDAPSGKAGE
jgi:hydrogenase maturation protease